MSEKKNYSKEQLEHGEEFAKLIMSYPEDKRAILLVAADAFMAGLSAKNTANEETPDLIKKEA